MSSAVKYLVLLQLLGAFAGSHAETVKTKYYMESGCKGKVVHEATQEISEGAGVMKIVDINAKEPGCVLAFCLCGAPKWAHFANSDCSGFPTKGGYIGHDYLDGWTKGECVQMDHKSHSQMEKGDVVYLQASAAVDVSLTCAAASSAQCQTLTRTRYDDDQCMTATPEATLTKIGTWSTASLWKVSGGVCQADPDRPQSSTKFECGAGGKYTWSLHTNGICSGPKCSHNGCSGDMDKTTVDKLMNGQCATWDSTTHSSVSAGSTLHIKYTTPWSYKPCAGAGGSGQDASGAYFPHSLFVMHIMVLAGFTML